MQIITNAECVYLGVKENIGKEDRRFYEISLEQNDSVCSLPTSQEVFNKINENKSLKYKVCVFSFAYDTRYNNLRVVNINTK